MKNKWNNILGNLLMAEAGGTTDAGGGGASTSFIAPGGSQATTTDGSSSAASGTGTNPTTTTTSSSAPATGTQPTDWRSTLPKELQEDASIKKFADVSTLAQSYLNAQKLIGRDKIPVPTKHSTDEEWNNIYKQLGLPEKVDDYGVKFKDSISVDQEFQKSFRENAHKLGILPKQAQALADWFGNINETAEQKIAQQIEAKFASNAKELRNEWGNSFDLHIARANKVANEVGGPELAKYLNETGLGGDKNLIKFLAKVGETLFAEHKFVEGQGTASAMDPKEIQREISKIQANPAYYDKQHPSQKALVQEMADLYKQLNPVK